jgi:hypothetical protein
LLPRYSTVEGLMETQEFDSANTVHAALRVLVARGKVQPHELIGYGSEVNEEEARRVCIRRQGNAQKPLTGRAGL